MGWLDAVRRRWRKHDERLLDRKLEAEQAEAGEFDPNRQWSFGDTQYPASRTSEYTPGDAPLEPPGADHSHYDVERAAHPSPAEDFDDENGS
jgi:hypothetical protein